MIPMDEKLNNLSMSIYDFLNNIHSNKESFKKNPENLKEELVHLKGYIINNLIYLNFNRIFVETVRRVEEEIQDVILEKILNESYTTPYKSPKKITNSKASQFGVYAGESSDGNY